MARGRACGAQRRRARELARRAEELREEVGSLEEEVGVVKAAMSVKLAEEGDLKARIAAEGASKKGGVDSKGAAESLRAALKEKEDVVLVKEQRIGKLEEALRAADQNLRIKMAALQFVLSLVSKNRRAARASDSSARQSAGESRKRSEESRRRSESELRLLEAELRVPSLPFASKSNFRTQRRILAPLMTPPLAPQRTRRRAASLRLRLRRFLNA
jgi:hypothetical protein